MAVIGIVLQLARGVGFIEIAPFQGIFSFVEPAGAVT